MGRFSDSLDNLAANLLDRTVYNVTQSSSELAGQMPSAKSIENQNLVRAELLKLQGKIQKYDSEGKAREPLASKYFIDHYNTFMVAIRDFAKKNAEQTNAAAITQTITLADAVWADIVRSDPLAKQLERVEPFLEAYSAKLKAETKLKNPYESSLNNLKNEAKTFVAGMNDKLVSTLETTLNTYDQRFVAIRAEITNPGDPATLKAGVTDPFYTGFVKTSAVKVEQVAANPTPGTVWYDLRRILSDTLPFAILLFVAAFFAILVANDMIHLPKYYRMFYFAFIFSICFIPGPNVYAVPLLGIYYFFKRFLYDSFKRDSDAMFGFSRDYVNGLTFYAMLPITALQTSGNGVWSYNEAKKVTEYDSVMDTFLVKGPSAQDKQLSYLKECAKIVGSTIAPTAGPGTVATAGAAISIQQLVSALGDLASRGSGGSSLPLQKLKEALVELSGKPS